MDNKSEKIKKDQLIKIEQELLSTKATPKINKSPLKFPKERSESVHKKHAMETFAIKFTPVKLRNNQPSRYKELKTTKSIKKLKEENEELRQIKEQNINKSKKKLKDDWK